MSRLATLAAGIAACILFCGCGVDKKPAQPKARLAGTQWALEEMGGKPVIEHSRATLFFRKADKLRVTALAIGSPNRGNDRRHTQAWTAGVDADDVWAGGIGAGVGVLQSAGRCAKFRNERWTIADSR